jgi:hypothetical protein
MSFLDDIEGREERLESRPPFVVHEATVSRVTSSEAWVTLDAYDDGLEYGPVSWVSGGQVPVVGYRCLAAITETGEVWAFPEQRPAVFVGMVVIVTDGTTPGPGWQLVGNLVDEGYPLYRFTGDREAPWP